MAGGAEFAALYDVKRLQVSQWISRDNRLDYRYAKIVSGSPYWLLQFAKSFGATTPRPKQLNEVVLARLVEEQSPGRWVTEVDQLPPLVGQAELVALFRLPSAALLRKAMSTGRLRPADYTLSGSPIWLLEPFVADAPALQASARGVDWVTDDRVLAALREGSYDGPGSKITPRGPAARKADN
ncbi:MULTISPECIES: hypothetical protein [unclassified Streptomyces]|uniref:hypothetical protein n=1 Tax=unclassified Streptomyces TaxID=2593676 RepID=UPI002E15954B|nr:hypothetical protein OG452_24865 [Streptomyces sp. NBC_01197]WSS49015.1 hypothetical protein OG708_10380 [Streptomyces sp. NBC_01180]